MAKNPESGIGTPSNVRYPAGTRLGCQECGAEVEIVSPCPCEPSDLVLQCCGKDMEPQTGKTVHVGVE